MILFFDKNTGTSIPETLRKLKPPFQVEYHQEHFALNEDDDKWLPIVGANKWLVIGHDHFDKNESEKAAVKKYKVGYFRMWGGNATKWQKMKIFFKACDKIMEVGASTRRPFLFKIKKNGHLKRVKLP